MKLHKRTMIVQGADAELGSLLMDWIQKHDLTWVEAVRCLMGQAQGFMKYVLRAERHPDDSEKRADEE